MSRETIKSFAAVNPKKVWACDKETGLQCMSCGKYSKPEDANNLNCRCGEKLIEVQS